jgi:hypothetical protein
MRLAKGLAGDKRFAVIDTENGRASMYADYFAFDVVELSAPFTPDRYLAAIVAAEKSGYGVILVDSMSHEWAGDGGILDMQEEELDRMAGDNWQKREAVKMASWVKPKMAHKSMMAQLLQLKAHVILCFRAEEKIEMAKENGKTVVRPKSSLTGLDGWIPITEKNLPYELTASFLLMAGQPGIPHPIKLQQQHKQFFPLDKPITEEAGRLIGEWAAGGSSKPETIPPKTETNPPVVETTPGVFEPKPELVAKKWFIRIEQAPNAEMLKHVGDLLKVTDDVMSDEDKATARQLYTARTKHFKNSSKAPDKPAGDREARSKTGSSDHRSLRRS